MELAWLPPEAAEPPWLPVEMVHWLPAEAAEPPRRLAEAAEPPRRLAETAEPPRPPAEMAEPPWLLSASSLTRPLAELPQ